MRFINTIPATAPKFPQPIEFRIDARQGRGFLFGQGAEAFQGRAFGKKFIPENRGQQPREGETWMCDFVRETDKAIIVRLVQRADRIQWGWSLSSKEDIFGVKEPVATPVAYPWLRECDYEEMTVIPAGFLTPSAAVKAELGRLPEMVLFQQAAKTRDAFFACSEPVRIARFGAPAALKLYEANGICNGVCIVYPTVSIPEGKFVPEFPFRGDRNGADHQAVSGTAIRDGESVSIETVIEFQGLLSPAFRKTVVREGELFYNSPSVAKEVGPLLEAIRAERAEKKARGEAEEVARQARYEADVAQAAAARATKAAEQQAERARQEADRAQRQAEAAVTIEFYVQPRGGKRHNDTFVRLEGARLVEQRKGRRGGDHGLVVWLIPETTEWRLYTQPTKDGFEDGNLRVFGPNDEIFDR